MAFTNIWDTTSPPDTEIANLYAANLRSYRQDIQERMGAISGLDAAKPAFASDLQPANWNGVLYFATDTGLTYQFQNPNWVPVTLFTGFRSFKDQTFKSTLQGQVGTPQTVYAIGIPPAVFTATTRVRITLFFYGNGHTFINLGTTPDFQLMTDFGITTAAQNRHIVVEGGNYGTLLNQYWMWTDIGSGEGSAVITSTTIDTTTGAEFLLYFEGVAATDTASFYGMGVELF